MYSEVQRETRHIECLHRQAAIVECWMINNFRVDITARALKCGNYSVSKAVSRYFQKPPESMTLQSKV